MIACVYLAKQLLDAGQRMMDADKANMDMQGSTPNGVNGSSAEECASRTKRVLEHISATKESKLLAITLRQIITSVASQPPGYRVVLDLLPNHVPLAGSPMFKTAAQQVSPVKTVHMTSNHISVLECQVELYKNKSDKLPSQPCTVDSVWFVYRFRSFTNPPPTNANVSMSAILNAR